MTSTGQLIDSLVARANPVRRLRPPVVRALYWVLCAALMLALVALGHGVRADLPLKLREPVFVARMAAAAATGILAAIAAFSASIPGRSPRWLLLPLPALAGWISTIGYGCLTHWVSLGADGISLGETARCLATLAIVGIPLSLMLLIMLRHAARLLAVPVAMAASLATAAIGSVALSLFHALDATVLILMWNLGLAVLLLVLGRRYGPRLFAWVTP